MAGGDARSALMHDLRGRTPVQQGLELGAQFSGRLESAIVADIQGAGAIQSHWNMAGYGIHGFGFAGITLSGTRLEHGKRRVLQIGQYGLLIYGRHRSDRKNEGWGKRV